MKLTSVIATLLAVPAAFAATVSVSFDQTYDNAAGSLATVACSDGANGLLTKGISIRSVRLKGKLNTATPVSQASQRSSPCLLSPTSEVPRSFPDSTRRTVGHAGS